MTSCFVARTFFDNLNTLFKFAFLILEIGQVLTNVEVRVIHQKIGYFFLNKSGAYSSAKYISFGP